MIWWVVTTKRHCYSITKIDMRKETEDAIGKQPGCKLRLLGSEEVLGIDSCELRQVPVDWFNPMCGKLGVVVDEEGNEEMVRFVEELL